MAPIDTADGGTRRGALIDTSFDFGPTQVARTRHVQFGHDVPVTELADRSAIAHWVEAVLSQRQAACRRDR